MQNMFGVYILQYNQSLVLQKQRFYQSIMTNTTWIHGYVFPAVCKPTFEHSKRQKILTGTLKIPALTLECHPNPLQNRSLMVGPKGNNLLHFWTASERLLNAFWTPFERHLNGYGFWGVRVRLWTAQMLPNCCLSKARKRVRTGSYGLVRLRTAVIIKIPKKTHFSYPWMCLGCFGHRKHGLSPMAISFGISFGVSDGHPARKPSKVNN